MKPKKILLLGATFGENNRGIGALAAGAVSILIAKYPDAEIQFLDYARKADISVFEFEGRSISIPLVNLRFSKNAFLPNNIAYLLLLSLLLKCVGQQTRSNIIENNLWIKSLCDADLAVAVSGGDSFSDIYGLGRFFYMSLPQILVATLGKRLILLPQTIGPFKSGLSRLIAKYLMNYADTVYSRDMEGVEQARKLLGLKGDGQKIRFCYDLGFLLRPHKPIALDISVLAGNAPSGKVLVGLNISGLLLIGGYTKKNMFHLKVDYRELIDRTIRFLIEDLGANVLLIPHVFGSEPESDTTAVSATYHRLQHKYTKNLYYVRDSYNEKEIKYVIGLCDFFIGSRMHACIAALSQTVPAIGIAYSRKFIGVLESIGVGHLVADPRVLTIDETLDLIGKAYAKQAEIKSHLQKTMSMVREQTLNLLADAA